MDILRSSRLHGPVVLYRALGRHQSMKQEQIVGKGSPLTQAPPRPPPRSSIIIMGFCSPGVCRPQRPSRQEGWEGSSWTQYCNYRRQQCSDTCPEGGGRREVPRKDGGALPQCTYSERSWPSPERREVPYPPIVMMPSLAPSLACRPLPVCCTANWQGSAHSRVTRPVPDIPRTLPGTLGPFSACR